MPIVANYIGYDLKAANADQIEKFTNIVLQLMKIAVPYNERKINLNKEEFATNLNLAFKRSGLKQSEIVKKTGITKSALSAYLNGEYIPKYDSVIKLAKALNVDESLLTGVSKQKESVTVQSVIKDFLLNPRIVEVVNCNTSKIDDEKLSILTTKLLNFIKIEVTNIQ